jgi:hypothetical protein
MNKVVYEAWKSKIDVVDEVRGGISEDAKSTLARVLNNTKNALNDIRTINAMKNEGYNNVGCNTPSTQLTGGIDWFPEHSIDMVSAIYASQIIDDIVSVQSIDSPLGVIRFLQYVYGNDRGKNMKKEGVAIDQWGAMVGAAAGNFAASEFIKGEILGKTGQGADNTKTLVEGFVSHLPIKYSPDAPIVLTRTDTNEVFYVRPCKCKDGSCGSKVSRIDMEGHEVSVSDADAVASVDIESGEIRVEMSNNILPNDGTAEIEVSYHQDLSEVPTDSMNLELRLRTEMIKAVPHKIRANFSFDASYALSKAHGINVEDSLVNACTAEIRQERDNEVISILMRQAGNRRTWDRTVTSYISQHDHDMSFLNELFACASLINYETKRGFGNWVVVGRQGLNIIKSAGSDHFKPAGSTLPNNGAFVVGELDGQMKVIYSPYVPQDAYLVGYKGSDMDAGFVVADFLPITKTDLVMLDDFVGRQGLVSYYGTKMLNPKMYCVGKIVGGDANLR